MQLSHADRKYLAVVGCLLVIFVAVFWGFAASLAAHHLIRFDGTVTGWVQSKIDPVNTRIMEFFTFVGSPSVVAVLVVCCSAILYWKGKRWEALALILATAGGALFNQILKIIFHRQRPDIHRLVSAHGYSFPSGHSFGSVVFYGLLSYFICLFARAALPKIVAVVCAIVLILTIGASRIYLGVHYPSDVFAGYTAGGVWLLACVMCFRFIVQKRNSST